MDSFVNIQLKDIAHCLTGPFGSQLHESDYVENGTPIVTVEHLGIESFTTQNLPFVSDEDKQRLSRYILKEGDIVFSRVGSIDRCTYVSEKEDGWMFSGRCIRVRANDKVNARYLSFYFRQDFFKKMMLQISVGATMPSLNTKLMDSIPLRIPKLSTQNKVAKILSCLDDKILINNRINAELEAMAKTLYDYWFVQFDFPNEQGKPYKFSGGEMVYNKELKREIPKGWGKGTLKEISDLVRGVSYNKDDIKKEENEDTVPILRATNINGNAIDMENMVIVPKSNVSSKQYLNKYDILITMSSGSIDHIGKNGLFYYDKKVSFGAFCAKLVAKPKYQYYMYSITQSRYMFETIRNECLGTNINNLNNSIVNGIKIVMPPNELIEIFNKIVSPIYEKLKNNAIQNQQHASLRDWLLPMLMNGQVKINSAEKKQYQSKEETWSVAAEPE